MERPPWEQKPVWECVLFSRSHKEVTSLYGGGPMAQPHLWGGSGGNPTRLVPRVRGESNQAKSWWGKAETLVTRHKAWPSRAGSVSGGDVTAPACQGWVVTSGCSFPTGQPPSDDAQGSISGPGPSLVAPRLAMGSGWPALWVLGNRSGCVSWGCNLCTGRAGAAVQKGLTPERAPGQAACLRG